MPVREASIFNYLRTSSNNELKKLVNFTVPACHIYLRVYNLQALLHMPHALHRHDLVHQSLVRDLNSSAGKEI
jgi:hypothetical protein